MNSIQCANCGNVSCTMDPFTVLKLKFESSVRKNVIKMKELYENNFAPEQFVEENKYVCLPCGNTRQNATKTSDFHSSCNVCGKPCYPETLLLSFARFYLNVQTGARTKITTPVDFGPTLTFKGLLIYNLIGIIIHDGDTDESGHYYAYLRLANGVGLGNSWFEVNDTVVRQVSDDKVDDICQGRHKPGVTPYILCYQCSPDTPSFSFPRCACRQQASRLVIN